MEKKGKNSLADRLIGGDEMFGFKQSFFWLIFIIIFGIVQNFAFASSYAGWDNCQLMQEANRTIQRYGGPTGYTWQLNQPVSHSDVSPLGDAERLLYDQRTMYHQRADEATFNYIYKELESRRDAAYHNLKEQIKKEQQDPTYVAPYRGYDDFYVKWMDLYRHGWREGKPNIPPWQSGQMIIQPPSPGRPVKDILKELKSFKSAQYTCPDTCREDLVQKKNKITTSVSVVPDFNKSTADLYLSTNPGKYTDIEKVVLVDPDGKRYRPASKAQISADQTLNLTTAGSTTVQMGQNIISAGTSTPDQTLSDECPEKVKSQKDQAAIAGALGLMLAASPYVPTFTHLAFDLPAGTSNLDDWQLQVAVSDVRKTKVTRFKFGLQQESECSPAPTYTTQAPPLDYDKLSQADLLNLVNNIEDDIRALEKYQNTFRYSDPEYQRAQKKLEQMRTQRNKTYKMWRERKKNWIKGHEERLRQKTP